MASSSSITDAAPDQNAGAFCRTVVLIFIQDTQNKKGPHKGTGYRYIPQKITLRLCTQHAGVRGLFFIRSGKLVGADAWTAAFPKSGRSNGRFLGRLAGRYRPEAAVHLLRISPTNKAMARATNPHQVSTSISLVDSASGSIKKLMRPMPAKKNEAQQDQIKILCKSPSLGDKYFRFIVVSVKDCYSAQRPF